MTQVILCTYSPLNLSKVLDSQPQEMGQVFWWFPLNLAPNECPLMHAEMLTEIGNMEAGN